jgi:hypothetical protein
MLQGPERNMIIDQQSLLRRLDAMEQLLQDMRSEILADETGADEVVQVPRQGAWRRQMLTELYPHIEHLKGVLALLDATAERAPEEVSYEEIKRRSGLNDRQQRSNHSALTRTANQILGQKTWPVTWRQTSDGAMRYWMPARMADWWRELRKSSSPH